MKSEDFCFPHILVDFIYVSSVVEDFGFLSSFVFVLN